MDHSHTFYLHLEGMDLAGKSTVAAMIARRSGMYWEIRNKSLSQDNVIQQFEKRIRKQNIYDDEIYGYLHYVSLLADIKYFERRGNLIQDSMLLLRSMIYHKEQKNDALVRLFESLVPKHPVPDLSVYLTTSLDVRKGRFRKRQACHPESLTKNDFLIMDDPERFAARDKGLMALAQTYFHAIVLDTSAMTAEETADAILSMCGAEMANTRDSVSKIKEEHHGSSADAEESAYQDYFKL